MVEIKEFLPNPFGKDTEGEYIIVLNKGSERANLGGLEIKDASGKSFALSGFLDAGKELKLSYALTKLNLNNGGETLGLYNSKGFLLSELSYAGAAQEGFIVMRETEGASGVQSWVADFETVAQAQIEGIAGAKPAFVFPLLFTGFFLAALSLWILKNFGEKNG